LEEVNCSAHQHINSVTCAKIDLYVVQLYECIFLGANHIEIIRLKEKSAQIKRFCCEEIKAKKKAESRKIKPLLTFILVYVFVA
jgi:hypothetical protein